MAAFESTRNIRHAIKCVMPLRPEPLGNRRLVRFLALTLVSLLVLLLALNLLSAVGGAKSVGVGLSIAWMTIVSAGAPTLLYLRAQEQKALSRRHLDWASDPRRLSIDRLGLDLAAGRTPAGLRKEDVLSLEGAATDWRHGREALDSLAWATGDLAAIRDGLRLRMDEAISNLLAESGSGSLLGVSPFALERARGLFLEIGREANQIASAHTKVPKFPTDDAIEAMRPELVRLRAIRLGSLEDTQTDTVSSPNKGS